MEKSSFFNSVAGDRKYNAADWAAYFASLVGNGVFGSPADNLKILLGENMCVTVSAGSGWINGYYYVNTSNFLLEVPTPDGVLPRIDRVVLQWNFDERNIRVKVKKGVPASAPIAPELQRDASIYELGLADILIPAGAGAVLASNITDLRGTSTLCGIVSSIVQEAHTHDPATPTKDGFMSAVDKRALDKLVAYVTQDVSTNASPTFKTVTADKIVGAVYG